MTSRFAANESTFRDLFAIDVRTPCGAVGINAAQKTVGLKDLKMGRTTRELLAFCWSEQRAHDATRLLFQNGFEARNVAGGMLSRAILMLKGT